MSGASIFSDRPAARPCTPAAVLIKAGKIDVGLEQKAEKAPAEGSEKEKGSRQEDAQTAVVQMTEEVDYTKLDEDPATEENVGLGRGIIYAKRSVCFL